MKNPLLFLAFALLCTSTLSAKTWEVGSAKQYARPSQVMNLVQNGDTVLIDAGSYPGDVGIWSKNDLVISCPNGMAQFPANGKNVQGKAIWVITGNNTSLTNIEFSGCTVPDQNGAGIRQEGSGLTLRHCYFHDNEDGVLTGASSTSDIVFEACEFSHNGFGDGYSHNMYIGHVRSFTMRYCYSHHAKIGHNVKSRAENNFILYNRIMDEVDGTSSFEIDLPNGGNAVILGNSIMKGTQHQNHILVNYGEEGMPYTSNSLYVINNTMVSDDAKGTFISAANVTAGAFTAFRVLNNIMLGGATTVAGPVVDSQSNSRQATFLDKSGYDYHLAFPLNGGVGPGSVQGFSLVPDREYVHPLDSAIRNDNARTIGAFAFELESVIPEGKFIPTTDHVVTNSFLNWELPGQHGPLDLEIFDLSGRLESSYRIRGSEVSLYSPSSTSMKLFRIIDDQRNFIEQGKLYFK